MIIVQRVLLLALVILCIHAPTSASADEYHSSNYRYGQRAMGMGGAATGLFSDPAVSYYNPAGLAFLRGAVFTGGLIFLGNDRRRVKFGIELEPFEPKDLNSDAFVAHPSSTVIFESFGGGTHGLALSLFLVSGAAEQFRAQFMAKSEADGITHRSNVHATRQGQDIMLLIGPSYALKLHPRFSMGVSLFYARRDQTLTHSSGYLDRQFDTATDEPLRDVFVNISQSAEASDGALIARLGLAWRPLDSLSLGLSISSRSLRLHGSGSINAQSYSSGDPTAANPRRRESSNDTAGGLGVAAETVYPWRFGFGASYQYTHIFTIAADVSVDLPVSYTRLGVTGAQAETISNYFVNQVTRELIVNASVGAEVLVHPRWPIRMGFFTNFSAAPDVPDSPDQLMAPKVNLYGVTASVGYKGDDRSINFGFEFQWGTGQDVAKGDFLPNSGFHSFELKQQRLTFFISGAFGFVGKTVKSWISADQKDKSQKKTAVPGKSAKDKSQP